MAFASKLGKMSEYHKIGDVQLVDYPEDIDERDHVGVYGATSRENHLAILSHYLHNKELAVSGETRKELVYAIKAFLENKQASELQDMEEEQLIHVADNSIAYGLFEEFFKIPFPAPVNPECTFIDLFAGMGGFRLAMQAHGGKCVFSSERNKFAQKTYLANFGEMPFGDITKEGTKIYIPKQFDVLCAGFPCQPFSIAGVSKKKSLGRETGFKDKTQGTLFFDVAEIISRHRPKAFFLENVKNLMSHDKGNTFTIIKGTLEELNYSSHYLVMDGQAYVPQHRERIMIVGFNKDCFHGKETFSFPEQAKAARNIKDILDISVDEKYTLSDKLWSYLQNYAEKHRAKGNLPFGVSR